MHLPQMKSGAVIAAAIWVDVCLRGGKLEDTGRVLSNILRTQILWL
jgi:hypothetical protein